jgi:nucleotide-binding universal stress UspA family protein
MSDIYIVGYDGTDASKRAVSVAAERASRSSATLHLVHVLEWSPYSFLTNDELAERHKRRGEELARAEALLEPVKTELKSRSVKATAEVRYGNAAEIFCEIAEAKKAAQIFIGRTGASSFTQRLLGGLVLNLVQVSPVPVTVVP